MIGLGQAAMAATAALQHVVACKKHRFGKVQIIRRLIPSSTAFWAISLTRLPFPPPHRPIPHQHHPLPTPPSWSTSSLILPSSSASLASCEHSHRMLDNFCKDHANFSSFFVRVSAATTIGHHIIVIHHHHHHHHHYHHSLLH
jgi:hypothetical protein